MTADSQTSFLARLDRWMASHPWHPRIAPFFVYIVLFALSGYVRDFTPTLYPWVYTIQCGVVAWMLWRYRKLMPELTLSFHWLAVPVGVFVFVVWISLGWMMAGEFGMRWDAMIEGKPIDMIGYADAGVDRPHFATDAKENLDFRDPANMGFQIGWAALVLRLFGMSLIVPMFEELFIRSLMLRSLTNAKKTWLGAQQFFCDVPMIGEWFIHTKAGEAASREPAVFTPMFENTPLGKLTVFGVLASTTVFMFSHLIRDWPGIWACGIAYCLLLAATRAKGLGPVIWAHGITNALLWVYTLRTGDWQFL